MSRQFAFFLAALALLGCPTLLTAADGPGVQGTLTVLSRPYQLAHAVAYETKSGDFELVTILASDRKIAVDKPLKTVREEGSDEKFWLSQPYVKVVFLKSGEVQNCNAWADNGSFSQGGDSLKGELKLVDGRVQGRATLAPQGEGERRRSFDFRFDLPLGAEAAAPAKPKLAGPVKATISGKFTGNGKDSKLAYVSARPAEPFADKPALLLIFTEKDHSKEPRPDIHAGFGKFGSALLISVSDDGSIFGCEVAHSGHGKKPFSSVGTIHMAEFDAGEGYVQGHLTTDGEQDALDQKWEVDLKFSAPVLGQKPKAASKPAAPVAKKSVPAPEPKPAAKTVNVHDLPLPKGASEIDYKKLVEQMAFKAPGKVQAVVAEFSKGLAQQGWKSDDSDLVTPQSAILKRERGTASLTVMVKPAGDGSQVQIFAEGLDWEDK